MILAARMRNRSARTLWIAVALLAAVAGAVAPTPAAAAGVYPPTPPGISTDSSVYPPGGDATVSLEGFEDCPEVVITIPGTVVVVVVAQELRSEERTSEVVIPMPDEPGDYEVVASCPATGETVSTTITVSGVTPTDPPPPSTSGSTTPTALPATGTSSGVPLQLGAFVLAAGATFLVVARRRSPHR